MASAEAVLAVIEAGGAHVPRLMERVEARLAELAASYGEVLAAILQREAHALVVGTRSAGNTETNAIRLVSCSGLSFLGNLIGEAFDVGVYLDATLLELGLCLGAHLVDLIFRSDEGFAACGFCLTLGFL